MWSVQWGNRRKWDLTVHYYDSKYNHRNENSHLCSNVKFQKQLLFSEKIDALDFAYMSPIFIAIGNVIIHFSIKCAFQLIRNIFNTYSVSHHTECHTGLGAFFTHTIRLWYKTPFNILQWYNCRYSSFMKTFN